MTGVVQKIVIARQFERSERNEAIYFSDLRINGESLTLSKSNNLSIRLSVIAIYFLLDSRDLDCFGLFHKNPRNDEVRRNVRE